MMSKEAPTIDFPCDYPVKVMGHATGDFADAVLHVCQQHAPEVDGGCVSVRESRAGNYLSVTVTIRATGEQQLQELFADLKTVDGIKLVL
ncbi:MAG: HP0495 family protein [Pseudomonadota bacterium]